MTKTFPSFSGANYSIEVNRGLSKVARFKLSTISQTYFEPLFTAPAWTTTADADHMGHRRTRHGHFRFDPRQICPLNALTTEERRRRKSCARSRDDTRKIGGEKMVKGF